VAFLHDPELQDSVAVSTFATYQHHVVHGRYPKRHTNTEFHAAVIEQLRSTGHDRLLVRFSLNGVTIMLVQVCMKKLVIRQSSALCNQNITWSFDSVDSDGWHQFIVESGC
jgi:hypothetical protein